MGRSHDVWTGEWNCIFLMPSCFLFRTDLWACSILQWIDWRENPKLEYLEVLGDHVQVFPLVLGKLSSSSSEKLVYCQIPVCLQQRMKTCRGASTHEVKSCKINLSAKLCWSMVVSVSSPETRNSSLFGPGQLDDTPIASAVWDSSGRTAWILQTDCGDEVVEPQVGLPEKGKVIPYHWV